MKALALFILLFVSPQGFACKLDGPIAGEGAKISGIMSRLYKSKDYRSYSFKSLIKKDDQFYEVVLKDPISSKCVKFKMVSTNMDASCSFRGSIKESSNFSCN